MLADFEFVFYVLDHVFFNHNSLVEFEGRHMRHGWHEVDVGEIVAQPESRLCNKTLGVSDVPFNLKDLLVSCMAVSKVGQLKLLAVKGVADFDQPVSDLKSFLVYYNVD